MKKTLSALTVVAILSGCSYSPSPDDTYRGAKQLARTIENTRLATAAEYKCEVDDRDGLKVTRENHGYETADCIVNDGSDTDATLSVIVATDPKGRSFIYDAPLLGAVFQDRGVLKSKTLDWEIQGSLENLSKLQDELGGDLTAGTRTK